MVTDLLTSLELMYVWKVHGHLTSQDQFTEGTGFSDDQQGTWKVHDQFFSLYQLLESTWSPDGQRGRRGTNVRLEGTLSADQSGSPTDQHLCRCYMSADHNKEYRDQKT
jgi:hypothetical protein